MSALDNGGPAFPSHGSMGEVAHEGMTLRDYFAAKAMQSLISVSDRYNNISRDDVVGEAYHYADDMLKARES